MPCLLRRLPTAGGVRLGEEGERTAGPSEHTISPSLGSGLRAWSPVAWTPPKPVPPPHICSESGQPEDLPMLSVALAMPTYSSGRSACARPPK